MTTPQPKPSRERPLSWLLLLVALGASVLLVRRAKHHRAVPEREIDIVSVVPLGPELLVTANVSALSPAVALELMQAGGGALLGLRELCGFEPILALRRVAFAVPFRSQATPGASDFAFIAQTSLEPEPVLRCAEAVMRKRGGQPVRSNLGSFRSVRDQGKPLGEIAIRDDGLFVLSGGQYFRDVVDAANGALVGDEAARLRTQIHAGIRRRLAPSLFAVTLLPGASVPLPGVQALGLGLEVGQDVRLRGFVGCVSAAACSDARGVIEQLKGDLARDANLSGLASLSIAEHEAQLDVSGRLPLEQLTPLLSQLLAP
jgi:hypothetical protein